MGIDGVASSSSSIKPSEIFIASNNKVAQNGEAQGAKGVVASETPAEFLNEIKGSEVSLKDAAKEVLRTLTGNVEKNEKLLKDLPPELRKAVEQILKNTVQQNDLSEGVVKFLQNTKSGAEQVMKLANNLEQLVKQMPDGAPMAELKEAVIKVLKELQLTANVNGEKVPINNENDLLTLLQKFDASGEKTLPAEMKKMIEVLQSQQKGSAEGQTNVSLKQELPALQKALQSLLQKMPDLPQNIQMKFQQLLTQGNFSAIISSLQSVIKEQEKSDVNGEKALQKILQQLGEQSDSILKSLTQEEKSLLNKFSEKLSKNSGQNNVELLKNKDEATVKMLKSLSSLLNLKETVAESSSVNEKAEVELKVKSNLTNVLEKFQLSANVDGQKVQLNNESDFVALLQKFNSLDEKDLSGEIKKILTSLETQKNTVLKQDVSTSKQDISNIQLKLIDILQKTPNLSADLQVKVQQIITKENLTDIIASLKLLQADFEKIGSNDLGINNKRNKSDKILKQTLEQLQEQSESLLKDLSPEEKEWLGRISEKLYESSGKIKTEVFQNKDDATAKLVKNLAGLFGVKDVIEGAALPKGQAEDAKKSLKELAFSMQKGVVVEGENTQLNKMFTVSVPLCFAEGESPYPAYIQVFKDKNKEQKGEKTNKKYGIWMRVVLETENIGVVENSFHFFGDNQLSVKIRTSDRDVVNMINEKKDEIKDALDELKLIMEDFAVNVGG